MRPRLIRRSRWAWPGSPESGIDGSAASITRPDPSWRLSVEIRSMVPVAVT